MKFLMFIVYFLTAFSSYAGVYQWKDSNGKTHFSDQPPSEKASEINSPNIEHSQEKKLFATIQKEQGKRVLKRSKHGDFYQYIPKNIDKAFAIVVVNHGMFSNNDTAKQSAYNTSRRWQRFSEATGAIIIAPVFDNHRYAVTTKAPQGWGYRGLFGRHAGADTFLNDIISYYKKANHYYDGKIFLSGHSAGAQFANRYLVRHPQRIRAAAFSAPAWFALPTTKFSWPNGMKARYRVVRWPGEYSDRIIDVHPNPNGWLNAAQLPVTVVVGANDLKKIRHVEGVGGDNHVDRARYWVKAMNDYAHKNGAKGQVKLEIVEGVGHNFGKLAAVCQDAMKDEITSYLLKEKNRIDNLKN